MNEENFDMNKLDEHMKDVIISISGTQLGGEDGGTQVELITDGLFCHENGRSRISYMESELTGMDGTKTTFDVTPAGIMLTREGTMSTHMLFEEGKKHLFVYDTPFGSTTMGINTKVASAYFNEHGGNMEIDYLVDFQETMVGRSMFKITVREEGNKFNAKPYRKR